MYILNYSEFLKNRDPALLRSLTAGWGPDHPEEVVNPLDPFPAPYQGFIREEFTIDGEIRSVYALIPPHFPSSGPAFQILLDDGQDAADFLASSPWVELAEQKGFVLIVADPAGKWDLSDGAARERKLLAAWGHFEYLQQIYITGFSRRYLIGYGKGGTVAALLQADNPAATAAVVAYGMEDTAPGALEALGGKPSAVSNVFKRDIPVVSWLIGKEREPQNAVAYFRASGACDDFVGEGEFGRVYRPSLRYPWHTLNTAPLWEVVGAKANRLPEKDSPAFFDLLFRFTALFARGFGNTLNPPLIAAATPEELGLVRHTDVVDGKLREWWVYVPKSVKASRKNVPMVMLIHGYSGNGRDYLTEGELHKVAEERGFIVVAPTGYRGAETVFRNGRAMQPQWNGHMEWKSGDSDDIHFVDLVMEHVLNAYHIDPRRCYMAGVSNGAMLVCKALFLLTHRFAAFFPSSGNMNDTHNPDENILPMDLSVMPGFSRGVRAACWIAKGEFDGLQKGMDTSLDPGKSNYELLRRIAQENGMDFSRPFYRENGVWHISTWLDKAGAPILRFTLGKGYPHGFPAELVWQMWDDFFCHYLRENDGTLVYIP